MRHFTHAAPQALSLVFALLVGPLFLVSTTADAAVHAYTVTGTIFPDLFSDSFDPVEFGPFENGATFTMTFLLDDSVAVGTNGSTFGIYGAISSVEIDFDTGDLYDTPSGSVITTISASNHAWDANFFPVGGATTTIPDLAFEDFEGNVAFGTFSGMQFVLFDTTSSMYSLSPPELFAADLTDANDTLVQINWEVDGPLGTDLASQTGSVDSITVPEPGLALALAAGALAISAVNRTRKGRPMGFPRFRGSLDD